MKPDAFPYGAHYHQDIEQLQALGKSLAPLLGPGHMVGLSGPLGVGKSTFARSIIQTLCPSVSYTTSPSFPLMIPYECENFTLWHMDLFRLSHVSEGDLEDLGLPELLELHPCLIEWPEYLHTIKSFRTHTLCSFSFEENHQYRTLMVQNMQEKIV